MNFMISSCIICCGSDMSRQRSTGSRKHAFAGEYDNETIYKWLQYLLLEILCTAVQAFLPAGRTEGWNGCIISERRLENAK